MKTQRKLISYLGKRFGSESKKSIVKIANSLMVCYVFLVRNINFLDCLFEGLVSEELNLLIFFIISFYSTFVACSQGLIDTYNKGILTFVDK